MKTGKVVTSCVIVTWSWVCNNTKSVEITRLPPFRKLEFQYGICMKSWILSVLRCFFYLFLLNELNKSQIQQTTKWCTVWILEGQGSLHALSPEHDEFLTRCFRQGCASRADVAKIARNINFLVPRVTSLN